MKNLLKLSVFIFTILSFGACSNGQKVEDKETATSKKENNSINLKKSSKMEHLTKESFKTKVFDFEANKEWKYEGNLPCIIDFYADWCAPCKMIAPTLEELAKEYEGKIYIYKVNTEDEQELAAAFGIRSIPSILFVPMNGQPQMSMGAMQKDGFVKAINDILLKK